MKNKQVGIIGLGRIGGAVARRLLQKKWEVVGFNRTESVTKDFENHGLVGTYSLEEFVGKLSAPRTVLLSLPHGDATNSMIEKLLDLMKEGDYIINSANNYYKDTEKQYKQVSKTGIHFVDMGISGGIGIDTNGACLMVGGDKKNFEFLEPLFKDIAIDGGVGFFEGAGMGHFMKMVHNGIEYGMMQAIAEGFGIIKKKNPEADLKEIARVYNTGSIIESRLVGWAQDGFEQYGNDLNALSGEVGFTGEGEWTAKTAEELDVPAPVIQESVKFRKESQTNPSFTGKVVSVIRNIFGGHSIERGKMT